MTMAGRILVLALILLVALGQVACELSGARFSAEPLGGAAPLEVQFTDQSKGEIETWQWDFDNDGVVDSEERNPKYLYCQAGNHTVSLTVGGPGGNHTAVKSAYIEIHPSVVAADFIANRTVVTGRVPIIFTDLSKGNITSWAWDFDSDGKIDSRNQNMTHTYPTNGTYSVTLTVAGPCAGDTLVKRGYITVSGCG